jgi:hypothetical protein
MRPFFNLKYIALLLLFLVSGCDDSFMERYPLDAISEQNFWKSESDLKLYVNRFYPVYIDGFDNALAARTPFTYSGSAIPYGDLHSDNALSENLAKAAMINNTYVKPSAAGSGGWNWGNVRALNYFLANYGRANLSETAKNTYLGEVLFFKTMEYFHKITLFGEVPWYSKPLGTDSKELYDSRTPRAALMDSMLFIIDKSVAYLPEKGKESAGRINKEMALLLKARVCLYEGTYRKYHKEVNLSGEKFLKEAVAASQQLMESGKFSIWSTGNTNEDYHSLFIQKDYKTNPEIILWKEYSNGLLMHGFLRYFVWNQGENVIGFTKSLVDEYLCKDGLPIGSSPLYRGDDSLQSEFANRDPRLRQTVSAPGEYALNPSEVGSFMARGKGYNKLMPGIRGTGEEFPTPTGYWPIKFWKNDQAEVNAVQTGTMPCPIFRYAEVLLVNAEAHAELGTCTQATLDKTVNLLRKRAGMPNLNLPTLPDDQLLDSRYQTYCGYIPSPLLREIRRERRVEFAWENFRWNDLVRWKAGKLLTLPEATLGMKFNQYQYPGVVVDRDVFLDNNGYLAPFKKSIPGGRKFEEPRQYFYPLPIEDVVVNPNLAQNPGW